MDSELTPPPILSNIGPWPLIQTTFLDRIKVPRFARDPMKPSSRPSSGALSPTLLTSAAEIVLAWQILSYELA